MKPIASVDIGGLLTQFLADYPIPSEAFTHIFSKVTSETIAKGSYFHRQGKICNKIGILFTGLLYASYCPEDTIDEKVSRFFYVGKNIIVTSFESFANQIASNESIVALEDSMLLCISKKELDDLYSLIPSMNHAGRKIAENSYVQALQRIHSLQVKSAKERIIDFREQHPALVNRVMVQQIASYLGMERKTYTRNAKDL